MKRCVLLAAMVACSSNGNSTVDGVTLTVMDASLLDRVAGMSPPTNDEFIVVDLKLANGAGTAMPLTMASFSLQLTSGLEYTGSALTSAYTGGCDPTASVLPGSSVSCAVVFQVPTASTPNSLAYALPDGHIASAATMLGTGMGSGSDYKGIGEPCSGTGQGTCPTGYDCLPTSLTHGTYAYCDKPCTVQGQVAECSTYSGPGAALCGPDFNVPGKYYCAIFCEGSLCPAGECDGTCPGSMTCVMAGSGSATAGYCN